MLVCGCGRWMHTQGVMEDRDQGEERWVVRLECPQCRRHVGIDGEPLQVGSFVDRLLWSDEAAHRVDRMPPYVQDLLKAEVEAYARSMDHRVVTLAVLEETRRGGCVTWEAAAERRLANVPSAVRGMARIELERTALERGHTEVTVKLMEEVKARYFGMTGGR